MNLRNLLLVCCLWSISTLAQPPLYYPWQAEKRIALPDMPVPISEVVATYQRFLKEGQPPMRVSERFGTNASLYAPISADIPLFKEHNVLPQWHTMSDGKLKICSLFNRETGETDSIAWRAAIARYGSTSDYWEDWNGYHDVDVLPFVFPDGLYFGARDAFPYMGFTACKSLGYFAMKDGEYRGNRLEEKAPRMSVYNTRAIIYGACSQETWRDWENPYEMVVAYVLLSHELTLYMKDYPVEEFHRTLFAEVGKDGHFILHALENDYSEYEQKVFAELQKAMLRVQPFALRGIPLDDGRTLPGHFLHFAKHKREAQATPEQQERAEAHEMVWNITFPRGFELPAGVNQHCLFRGR